MDLPVEFLSGVPCSYLKPLRPTVNAPEEGLAVAVAAGAWLGGQSAGVFLQNSGLGNAVNPLASLCQPFGIPLLLLVSRRGGAEDEPQHALMGELTGPLLTGLRIEWESGFTAESLERARASLARGRSYALVLERGSLKGEADRETGAPRLEASVRDEDPPNRPQVHRRAMLEAVLEGLGPDDLVLASTGYTGRELYALDDRPSHFYMVGSMGCVSAVGLGLALARPERRVVLLDGDGALLMRLGALPMLGRYRPGNLVHLVLDNQCHDSTGGQPTLSRGVDLPALARACGYPRALRLSRPEQLREFLARPAGPLPLVHLPILPGTGPLPRPTLSPLQQTERFREFLRNPAD